VALGVLGFATFQEVIPPNASGSTLLYSTYLGGERDDQISGLAVDASGSVYVGGSTSSLTFPIVNAFQPTYGGSYFDAFVSKLSPSGSAWVYSSYLGGLRNAISQDNR